MLFFIRIFRYYAIAAPLHYGTLVNSRKIMLGLCGTWIVCLLISMPPIFRLVPYTYQPGLPVCTIDFGKGRATIIYSIFYTTITLVLPGVIILGCNIKVSHDRYLNNLSKCSIRVQIAIEIPKGNSIKRFERSTTISIIDGIKSK